MVLSGSILISEFLAPYALNSRHDDFIFAPPQHIHLFQDGRFVGPHVLGYDYRLDMKTLKRVYTPSPAKVEPLRFFCHGDPYWYWGLVQSDVHLLCAADGGTAFLLGTDRLGRDMLSRILYGARISLTVGLIGVAISFTLGLVFGGIAGYYGGWVDMLVTGWMDIMLAFPSILLALAVIAILGPALTTGKLALATAVVVTVVLAPSESVTVRLTLKILAVL